GAGPGASSPLYRTSGHGSVAPMGEPWLVYACRSGYVAEVVEIIWRGGGEVAALVDNLPDGPRPSELGRTIAPGHLGGGEGARPAGTPVLAPGSPWGALAAGRAAGMRPSPPLVDATAVVARTAALDEGVVINALAAVGARARIGPFVHINRSASVGHDVAIEGFVSLGPGCVVAGHVVLESGATVGAGAVLARSVRVGANAKVAAGAVVLRDVPARTTVIGNPARAVAQK